MIFGATSTHGEAPAGTSTSEPAPGSYRERAVVRAPRSELPARLQTEGRRDGLVYGVLRPAVRFGPALVVLAVGVRVVLISPLRALLFLGLAGLTLLSGVASHRPWRGANKVGSYRDARDSVKAAFREQGGAAARALTLEYLAKLARKPWSWSREERDKALLAYATIVLTLGEPARALAVREHIATAWLRRQPTFACAAALAGDEQAFHASMPLPGDLALNNAQRWPAARALGRRAGFAQSGGESDAQIDEALRKSLTHLQRSVFGREYAGLRSWPGALTPWDLFVYDRALEWIDRGGAVEGLDEARAHLQRERERLGGSPA